MFERYARWQPVGADQISWPKASLHLRRVILECRLGLCFTLKALRTLNGAYALGTFRNTSGRLAKGHIGGILAEIKVVFTPETSITVCRVLQSLVQTFA